MEKQKFGRYEVIEEIGRGSMGVVYRAIDPLIQRDVAIKTVPLGIGVDPERRKSFLNRLRRESHAAGALNHPNIVVVYDAGDVGDSFFIAMEYLRGQSIDKTIRGGKRFSPVEVIEMITPVADALDYAHANKVIHRDIKPSNLFITDKGIVKITDFGIAKLPLTSLTGEGRIVGSPSYMSPEQINGSPLDGRSDVFSLGVVVYILLTGKKPFGGGEVADIIQRILNNDPMQPSKACPDLPEAVDKPVIKAMAKEPRMRYPTAIAFLKDFAEAISFKAAPSWGSASPSKGEDSGSGSGSRSGTGEIRRPSNPMDRFREERDRNGFSKIEQVFHEITSEVRSSRFSDAKKKPKKRK